MALFISLSIGTNGASVPPSVGFHNKFLTTGTVSIDTSTSFNNASAVWNPISYNLSYPSTFVTVTNVQIGLTLQAFSVNYINNGIVHLYAKISAFRSAGFQLDIYSSYALKFQKVTYMYVVVANYYTTFNNFRVFLCELSLYRYIYYSDTTPEYLCSIDPPLNSTNATAVGSFYGIDLSLSNYNYCLD